MATEPHSHTATELVDEEPWAAIWEKKGKDPTADPRAISGWQGYGFDFKDVAQHILTSVKHQEGDSILEVGCGAGTLAVHLPKPYVGVERSHSIVQHEANDKHEVHQGEADKLPFDDDSFDHVIVQSVFHYFKDKEYAERAFKEMDRIARKSIFVGDIRTRGREHKVDKSAEICAVAQQNPLKHLLFDKKEWTGRGYRILEPVHDHYGKPFDAMKLKMKLEANEVNMM